MIERTLIVSGTVQMVGYRDIVRKNAFKNDIVGYVQNMPDDTVKMICQGEKKNLGIFTKILKTKQEFVDVKGVEVVEEKEIENLTFERFTIKYDDLAREFGERMVQGIRYMKGTQEAVNEMGCKIDSMNENLGDKMDSMNENLGEKFDHGFEELGNKLDSVNENLGNKLDSVNENLGNKLDSVNENLGNKLDSVNENLGCKMDSMNDNLGEKIENGFESTGEQFQSLDGKYHTVTEELRKIRRGLEKGLKVEGE